MRGLLSLVNEEEAGTDSLQEVISKQNKHFHSLPIFFSFQLILSLFYVAGRWRPSHWGGAFGDQVETRNSLDRVFWSLHCLFVSNWSFIVCGGWWGDQTWMTWLWLMKTPSQLGKAAEYRQQQLIWLLLLKVDNNLASDGFIKAWSVCIVMIFELKFGKDCEVRIWSRSIQ